MCTHIRCWDETLLRLTFITSSHPPAAHVFILRALHDIYTISLGLKEGRKAQNLCNHFIRCQRKLVHTILLKACYKPPRSTRPTIYLVSQNIFNQRAQCLMKLCPGWALCTQLQLLIIRGAQITLWRWHTQFDRVDKHWNWSGFQGFKQDVKRCAHTSGHTWTLNIYLQLGVGAGAKYCALPYKHCQQ